MQNFTTANNIMSAVQDNGEIIGWDRDRETGECNFTRFGDDAEGTLLVEGNLYRLDIYVEAFDAVAEFTGKFRSKADVEVLVTRITKWVAEGKK